GGLLSSKIFPMSEEILDVVDEQDNLIGKETRKKVHEVGLWHRGVHVFLFDEDGNLLIQKRSADRASNPLRLDCSVSEHVQSGESYQQAAIRGLKEEMGVENIQIKKLAKFRMNYGINDNEISELYEGVVEPSDVKFDSEEIESVSYVSMDELRKMLKEDESKFCYWFVEILKMYWGEEAKMYRME
ncbi:MAG TPA: hypothetical protein DIW23_06030, partial [Anaerolineae bacterium]|nr:hypothetical protein [Anaerolineae bacterium]